MTERMITGVYTAKATVINCGFCKCETTVTVYFKGIRVLYHDYHLVGKWLKVGIRNRFTDRFPGKALAGWRII